MGCMTKLFLPLLCIAILVSLANTQCCKEYTLDQRCLSCPDGMHIFMGNCIFDVEGCLQYNQGVICSQCQFSRNYILADNRCEKITWDNFEDTTGYKIPIGENGPFNPEGQYFDEIIRKLMPKLSDIDGIKMTSAKIRYNSNTEKGLGGFVYVQQPYQFAIDLLFSRQSPGKQQIIRIRNHGMEYVKQRDYREPIDVDGNLQHFYQTQIITFFLKQQQPSANTLISGEISDQRDKGKNFVTYYLVFSSDDGLDIYDVVATISDNQEVNVQSIKKRKSLDGNNVGKEDMQNNQGVQQEEQIPAGDFTNTEKWLIFKDFLETQFREKYADSLLEWVKVGKKPNNHQYRVGLKTRDQRQWQIIYILQGFVIKIIDERPINQVPTVSQEVIEEEISPEDLLKDFHYLISLSNLVKNSQNGRYYFNKEAKILRAIKRHNKQSSYCQYFAEYRLQSGLQWQVHTKISIPDCRILDSDEKLIKDLQSLDSERNEFEKKKPHRKAIAKEIKPEAEQISEDIRKKQIILTQQTQKTRQLPLESPPKSQKQQQQVHPVIRGLTIGQDRVSYQEIQSKEFQQINQIITNVNRSDLQNSDLNSAFFNMKGFNKNYRIFYRDRNTRELYEARVSRDLLKRKNYLISFNRIGY